MHAAPALRAAALLLLLGLSGAQFGFDLAQVQQIVAQQTVRARARLRRCVAAGADTRLAAARALLMRHCMRCV
jgi:hypothetical protein